MKLTLVDDKKGSSVSGQVSNISVLLGANTKNTSRFYRMIVGGLWKVVHPAACRCFVYFPVEQPAEARVMMMCSHDCLVPQVQSSDAPACVQKSVGKMR